MRPPEPTNFVEISAKIEDAKWSGEHQRKHRPKSHEIMANRNYTLKSGRMGA
jgi:hypothetical protein